MLQVVTDSSCDLPDELIKQHNIHIIPLTISIDDRSYLERYEISPEEFYRQMAKGKELPKTSQPTPGHLLMFSASCPILAKSSALPSLLVSAEPISQLAWAAIYLGLVFLFLIHWRAPWAMGYRC